MSNALAIALLEGRGFTALEFANFHPGGELGAMLKFVRDIMHTGDAIPIKPLGTRMSDALVEMSAKGFGCVCIVDDSGEIAGIITDGDLRRQMRPDLMTALVEDVMTKNPRTIAPGMLASGIVGERHGLEACGDDADCRREQEPVGMVRACTMCCGRAWLDAAGVIPGWSEGPDLRCAIAHRGIFEIPGSLISCAPRNDGS